MTKRQALILTALVALALCAWALWSAASKGEAAEIQKLADLVAEQDDAAVKTKGEALAKKYKELGPFMNLFKKRGTDSGGLGVGRRAGVIQPDGIEAKIKALAKNAPSTAELDEQGDDLIRMTQMIIAIGEVTKHKCEVDRPVGIMDPKDWNRWSEAMQQSSRDLAEAIKVKDGIRVKVAAVKLSATCNSCHRVFRE
jgi:hypothetical protein